MVLLGVGTNAWGGEESTIYERGVTTAWSTSDYTTSALTANKWYSTGTGNTGVSIATVDAVNYLHISARGKTTTGTSTLSLSRSANTIVKINAVMNTGSSTFPANENRITFKYGAFTLNYYTRNSNAEYYINSTKTDLPTLANNIDLTIQLEVNSVDGNISKLKVTRGDTSADIIDIAAKDEKSFNEGTNYETVIWEAYCNVSSNNTSANLKSIVVKQETQDVQTASVTYKYEDTDGNSLSAYKADQVQDDVAIGTTISTLISSFAETFYNGTSNKYVYSGSYVVEGDYTTVQSGGNTVTLKFTDYPATAYTVKAQVGGEDLATIASGTAFLDGSTTATYSKYVKSGGTWYETTSPYGIAVTSASPKVTYTARDISYFYEYEGLSGSCYTDDSNSYSGGQRARLGKGATLSSDEAITGGFYTLKAAWANNNNTANTVYISTIKDAVTTATGQSIVGAASSSGTAELTVRIPDGASIAFVNNDANNNSNVRIDYVTLTYLAPLNVAATITADGLGYATFSSTYALDFTDVTEATAYIATAQNGDNITMKPITGTVAANTGLVLKSANGSSASFNIPTTTSGTVYNTESETKNYLFAISSGYDLGTSSTGTNYVLSVQEINDVETVVWAPIADNNNKAPVTANHAALWIPATNNSRSLRMVFGDNSVTGISDAMRLNDKGQKTNDVFNLNGQRVKKAAKGLYIVNGKKYIK